mmetsp:Transcript_6223/g.9827  ORF Transcript_6223/g.9827 Transcript_6223/m.9827 type:complete len:80 (-) Transcript_6223:707-946(-)
MTNLIGKFLTINTHRQVLDDALHTLVLADTQFKPIVKEDGIEAVGNLTTAYIAYHDLNNDAIGMLTTLKSTIQRMLRIS